MIAENYKKVMTEISRAVERVGRSAADVKLIAVTKTVGIETVRQAAGLGITDFGENRVQEAEEKVRTLPDLNWHFIGHLQSNKARDVISHYGLIHSLDRLSLAKALQRCAEKTDQIVDTLIQVNVSGEESKFGLEPEKLAGFIEHLAYFDRIKVKGLMTMAPFVDEPEEVRPCFKKLRELRDAHAKAGLQLAELSMGMTNDYVIAVEEGATMVRIGSALFN